MERPSPKHALKEAVQVLGPLDQPHPAQGQALTWGQGVCALGWVGLDDQGWAVVWAGGHVGRGKSPGSRTRPGPGSQPCHPPTDCVTGGDV